MLTLSTMLKVMALNRACGERGSEHARFPRIVPPKNKTGTIVRINIRIGQDPNTGEWRMMRSDLQTDEKRTSIPSHIRPINKTIARTKEHALRIKEE